jgi:branched-chain amino acid transport system substrate-binding protein
VTAEKRKLHIVTGGHTDEITGSLCSWNVFRVCKSTTMEANAIAEVLIEKFGARWYFLTPDYVYGQTLQAAFELKLRQHGGSSAADILPIGTVDYSDALTNAAAFRPKVLIDLMSGEDQINSPQADRQLRAHRSNGGRRRPVRAGKHLIRARRSADRLVDHGMVVESA